MLLQEVSDQMMRLMDPEPHILWARVFGPKIDFVKILLCLGWTGFSMFLFLDFIIFIEFRLGMILYYYLE